MSSKKGRQYSFKMKDFTLIVLAAGKGTRLNMGTPKPLVKIGDRHLIDPILSRGEALGFGQIIVVISDYTAQIAEIYANKGIEFINSEPRGTGQSVIDALPYVKYSNVIIAHADDSFFYSESTLRNLAQAHLHTKALMTIGVYLLKEDKNYTPIRFDAKTMRLEYMSMDREEGATPPPKFINCGLYAINKQWLSTNMAHVKPSSNGEIGLPYVVNYCTEQDREKIFTYIVPEGEWHGVNTPEEYQAAAIRVQNVPE